MTFLQHRLVVKIIASSLLALSLAIFTIGQFQFRAEAAVNLTMNYQGKLTNASNVAVADGTYNMRFKLYDTIGSGDPPTGGTLLWTETRTGADKVQVTNGIFSVMLGDVTALTSVDFNQTLFLSVEIGGTGSPGWDGEMAPRKKVGTVPAAFLANTLEGTGKIDLINTSANQAIIGYDGSNKLSVGVASNGFTTLTAAGSGAGFNLTGGNVGIGTSTLSAKLHVTATTEQFRTSYDAANYTSFTTSSGGDLTIAPSGSDLAITGNVDVSGTFTAATANAFTINSSGAITAAAGITSSGTITFSGLGGSGTKCLQTDNSGVISAAAAACGTGGSPTPWTSAIDADGYALQDALNLEFRTAAGSAPGGTVIAMYADNSGDLTANVLTAKTFNIAVNGSDEYNFSSSALAMNSNNITGLGTGITATAGLTVTSTSADLALTTATSGNITFAPASTGSLQITSGVTTGTGTSAGLSLSSTTVTSGDLVSLSQSTSTNTGTGLKINMANGSGTFTGNLVDFQVNGTSRFKVGPGTITTSGSTAVAGLLQDLVLTNGTGSGFQFGNRLLNTVNGGTAGSHVGQFIRMTDSTSLSTGQIVRGIEVQAYSGTNNNGINTGIQTYGKTFGLSAETTGQAGGVALPAAVFADLNNGSAPTVGNAIRAYTDNATSATLVQLFQDTTAYTGTGLQMDFGNNSGSFIGNFSDYLYQGASKYKLAYSSSTSKTTETFGATGSTTDYASGTNGNTYIMKIPQKATTGTCASAAAEGLIFQTSGGTQVGHMCISGPTAGAANKLTMYAEAFTGTSTDVAENYTDISGTLEAGDVVKIDPQANKAVTKTEASDSAVIAGVISTSPGLLLAGISESNGATDLVNPTPVALTGRVPVKVTNENGAIAPGDFLTVSTTRSGYAMKATGPGQVIGQALTGFNSEAGKVEAFIRPTWFAGLGFGETIASNNPVLDNIQVDDQEIDLNNIAQAEEEGGLSINHTTSFHAGLRVDSISSLSGKIAFQDDVIFFGRPYFNKDTAGFAIIREGDREVEVIFDNEYLEQPIVHITINLDKLDDDDEEEQSQSYTLEELEDAILEGDLKYIVTQKSAQGFVIKLGKSAPVDMQFSWTALAVKNPHIFQSNIAGIEDTDPGAGDAEEETQFELSDGSIIEVGDEITNGHIDDSSEQNQPPEGEGSLEENEVVATEPFTESISQ